MRRYLRFLQPERIDPNRQIGTGKGTAANMEKERCREPMWPDMSGVPLPYGYQRIISQEYSRKGKRKRKKR